MTSFLPINVDQKKQTDLVLDEFGQNQDQQKYPWKIDENPFNEFNTEYLATMSFPTLFPPRW